MDEYRMVRRVLMAEVSGGTEGRLDGRLEGACKALSNSGMTVEAGPPPWKELESPGTYVTKWVSRGQFCLALAIFAFNNIKTLINHDHDFGPPSRALVVITWRGVRCRYMMRLGRTVKRAQLLNIKAQMSSIWAKGCMLIIVFVLSDLTWLPLLGGGRKSWYIIIIRWCGTGGL